MFFSTFRVSVAAAMGLLVLAGCSSNTETETPANLITQNDFEGLDGWVPGTPSLTTEKAHSGRFSTKVDKDAEYSLSYVNLLGKASAARIQKIKLSGWVLLAGPKATATVVVQVVDPAQDNKQVFWEGIDLSKEVKKTNEWTEVSKEFTLPANLEAGHQLRVYMWRGGAEQPAYLDDLTLTKSE